MLALQFILADGITIRLGSSAWTFDSNFLISLLVYLVIAAIVGFVAEALVGRRLPFGFIGAIIASLIGVWLLTRVIIIDGVGDFYVPSNNGVPIFRALIGAIIIVAIWQFLTSQLGRGRRYRRD